MLRFDRKQQNSVKQLSFNKKNKLIKKNYKISFRTKETDCLLLANSFSYCKIVPSMNPKDIKVLVFIK